LAYQTARLSLILMNGVFGMNPAPTPAPGPPTLEQLLAFADGSLEGAAAQAVEQALRTDPEAARTVAWYRQAKLVIRTDDSVAPTTAAVERAMSLFVRHAAPRKGWRDLIDRFVATLVFDSRVTPLAVRSASAEDHRQWTFESKGMEIDLQAQRTVARDQAEGWSITGQVSDASDHSPMPIALFATGADEPLIESHTDAHGMFQFAAPPGRYHVLLMTSQGVVEVPSLDMP